MSTMKINDIKECLAALGSSPELLSDDERVSLDNDGYVVFDSLIEPAWLKPLAERFEQIVMEEGDEGSAKDRNLEHGARRPSDLANKGEVFDGVYTHPKVLAAVHYILKRSFKLSNFCGRDALPGMGQQRFHVDWGSPIHPGEPFHAVNTIWLIDDFTERNGATRLIPGSHKWYGPMEDHYTFKDSFEEHPQQVLLEAPKGSVVVFNLHLWHSGRQNDTTSPRRGLFAHFNAREHGAHLDHGHNMSDETRVRLSEPAKYLLDL